MEVGYSTLDLAMLVIAAFVIWVAMHTPKTAAPAREKKIRSLIRPESDAAAQPLH